ncbi:glycerophosphodiester phosphodiesterase family protein [Saccharicrinis sp. 156]|uniref:glycerophosphodiester phosphodiesterase family protein n=1 Tax=Saccharicrinis sp. 156 TaxID=3417574 RepID=UPI003D34AEB4
MDTEKDKMIIAHRGESFIAPENTLASVQLAWNKGVKAVEVDVRLTLDNQVILMHDKTTKRTGDINNVIAKSTLDELRKVDIGVYKGKKWRGEQIPKLSEVLKTVPVNGKLIIEIKSDSEIIGPLVDVIKSSGLAAHQIEIISFNIKILAKVKKLLPQNKVLWLLDLDYYLPAWMLYVNTQKIIRKLQQHKLDGVDVWAGKKINALFVEQVKRCKLLVYTWTTNDIKSARNLLAMQVDAITSDKAGWLIDQL